MHSYLPHPNDRLIILLVRERFDEADRQSIASLFESRLRECHSIHLLLDLQNVSGALSPDWWLAAFQGGKGSGRVVRLAIIGGREVENFVEDITSSHINVDLRFFAIKKRKNALLWIQGGTG